MNYIDISNLQLEKNIFNYGGESTIYKLKNQDIVYKHFDILDYNKIINKVNKMECLNNKTIKDNNLVIPDTIVMDKEKYNGLLMPLCEGRMLNEAGLNYEKTKDVLYKIKDIILKLNNNGIKYYDLNPSNIMYSANNISFIDVDNIEIDNYTIDTFTPFLYKYIGNGGKLDYNALVFTFNHLCVSMLSKYDIRLASFDCIPDYLYKDVLIKYNRYIERIARDINNCVPDSSADNMFLLDYYEETKSKQI